MKKEVIDILTVAHKLTATTANIYEETSTATTIFKNYSDAMRHATTLRNVVALKVERYVILNSDYSEISCTRNGVLILTRRR